MNVFNYDGHASSLLPEGKNWQLVWNDEFDGTELDRTKWGGACSISGANPFPRLQQKAWSWTARAI